MNFIHRTFLKFKRWLFTPPSPHALFLTNVRAMARQLHTCEWEHRPDPGEEEHGPNIARRHCKVCGHTQLLFYSRFGNVRTRWVDMDHVNEKDEI